MKLELCEKRKAILSQAGHLLVLGGPGSGKTTIALLKAQRRFEGLRPGQEILFLSFSRAAIRQVVTRCKEILTHAERRSVVVKTYHAFCLEILAAHGRLLRGVPIQFLYPGDERLKKSDFDGDWDAERLRLAKEESLFCFDLFASGVADLLERCTALRRLIGDAFPMIIVDEFQDTDNNQWRIVRALAEVTDVFCLADAEQRIFDYRSDIDPLRIQMLREQLNLTEFDLGGENHRSPNAGILSFADAVLNNRGPLPSTPDVKTVIYRGNGFASIVHASVIWMFSLLHQKGIEEPCVAVLCRSNSLIADISGILSEQHEFKGKPLRPIAHDVVWDADLSAAAAVVVASILEWPSLPAAIGVARTLKAVSVFYKLKNAEKPTKTAADWARKYDDSAAAVAAGGIPRIVGGKALVAARAVGIGVVGDPIIDWREARRLMYDIEALAEVLREARLVRLFRATDALASGLASHWLEVGSYAGATGLVKRILDQERLLATDRDPHGCVLMNMHKSKGKEFDGVVIIEGAFKSGFFNEREKPPYEPSRRLLRVAITRARTFVILVRPHGGQQLVG